MAKMPKVTITMNASIDDMTTEEQRNMWQWLYNCALQNQVNLWIDNEHLRKELKKLKEGE